MIVKGRDLMKLGMKGSPRMGEALKWLYEAQLDGKFFDLESGLELFRASSYAAQIGAKV
jgi:hypothetical protein